MGPERGIEPRPTLQLWRDAQAARHPHLMAIARQGCAAGSGQTTLQSKDCSPLQSSFARPAPRSTHKQAQPPCKTATGPASQSPTHPQLLHPGHEVGVLHDLHSQSKAGTRPSTLAGCPAALWSSSSSSTEATFGCQRARNPAQPPAPNCTPRSHCHPTPLNSIVRLHPPTSSVSSGSAWPGSSSAPPGPSCAQPPEQGRAGRAQRLRAGGASG